MTPTSPSLSRPPSAAEASFLVFDDEAYGRSGRGARRSDSPIRFLRRVMEEGPAIALVRFKDPTRRERSALVELCAAIKRRSPSRATLVVALLTSRHRGLVKDLQRAGVDYIRCVGLRRLDGVQVRGIATGLGVADTPAHLLAAMCPYLRYKPIDDRRELIVCGAYRERLVLGGCRLAEICQGEGHLACEYFLDPRETA